MEEVDDVWDSLAGADGAVKVEDEAGVVRLVEMCVSKNVLNDRTLVAFVDERIVHLKLSGASAHITDAGLESITRCCSGLQSLSLYGVSNCSPDALARLFSSTTSLTSVNLSKCPVATKPVIDALVRHSTGLRTLILNRNNQVRDDFLLGNLPHVPHLQELAVLGCPHLTGQFLRVLPHHNSRLTALNLSRCTQLKSDELLVECFSRMPYLQNLKLAKLRKLSDRVLDCIGDHLAGVLCELDIRLCSSITESALIRVLPKLQELRMLGLPPPAGEPGRSPPPFLHELYLSRSASASAEAPTRCPALSINHMWATRAAGLTDGVVTTMLQQGPKLKELYVSDAERAVGDWTAEAWPPRLRLFEAGNSPITDQAVEQLCLFCPRLEVLDLGKCSRITPRICESIGRLGHLQNLNLSGIAAIDDQAVARLITQRTAHTLETLTLASCGVSADCLAVALLGLPNLTALNVQDCAGVSCLTRDHPAVVALEARRRTSARTTVAGAGVPLHDLSSLCLSGCRHLAGTTLATVLEWCGRLHDLQFAENAALADDDLVAALPRQSSLHALSLAKLPHLASADRVVAAVARACPDLIYLNLSGTRGLSDAGFREVLERCRLLQTMHASQCGITDDALEVLLPPSRCGQALQLLALTDTRVSKDTCAKLVQHFPFLQIHFGGRIYDGEEFVAAQRPPYVGFIPGARQTPDPAEAGRTLAYWLLASSAALPPGYNSPQL
ncbi:leucine rich repeat domain containing protein [Acanthamoeba castellanii str. Neff]|uniref:Leucine rich repeat domain containing protein n=1 Tax=Acanthamoeba castellanii (strain ATCC 30010 / Neff) TaxID=1257118 RepID=L8H970_ACACF|nr:leucine rich repeat domain containing protein [Acanthamoeba castellanii str. Neff]ELR22049.1 leucine rich repeat domain containing protein [Acanthamoeba castellanii str. Neff]